MLRMTKSVTENKNKMLWFTAGGCELCSLFAIFVIQSVISGVTNSLVTMVSTNENERLPLLSQDCHDRHVLMHVLWN